MVGWRLWTLFSCGVSNIYEQAQHIQHIRELWGLERATYTIYVNNKLLWTRKYALIVVCGYHSICSETRTVGSSTTVSLEEQIMSKDNYSCIFPKPKVVYCLYYSSNISSHNKSSDIKQNKTKHEANHVDFLVLSDATFECFKCPFPHQ